MNDAAQLPPDLARLAAQRDRSLADDQTFDGTDCRTCDGTGESRSGYGSCMTCRGRGYLLVQVGDDDWSDE